MAESKYKLKKGQYVNSVINPGIDKTIPVGNVQVVYNADGTMAGFLRDGSLYQPGEKVVDTKKPKAKTTKKTEDIPSVGPVSNPKTIADLQRNRDFFLSSLDIAPVDSPDYINAKLQLDETNNLIKQKQDEEAKAAAAPKEKAIADAQKSLEDAQRRAKDKGVDPTTDAKVKAAQDKLTQVKGQTTEPAYKPGAPTGIQGPTATISATTKATGSTGSTTGSTTTTTASGTTSSTTTSGAYTTKGGLLYQGGQLYSGKYKSTYYKDGKVETPAQIKQDFLSKFAVQAALISSDPGLSDLFSQAIANNWSADMWKLKFENSDWYKSRAGSARTSEIQRVSSPVDYAQSYNNARLRAIQAAAGEGVSLSAAQQGAEISSANATVVHPRDVTGQDLAQWVLDNNPTDAALRAHLIQVGKINQAAIGGQIAAQANSLKSFALEMGIGNLSAPSGTTAGEDWFTQSAKQIESGTTTIDAQKEYIKNLAKSMFPAYADQIDKGISVKALASPYLNSLGNLMEVNTDQYNLTDSTGFGAMVAKAMRGNNDPKNPIPTDLSTFENQVRSMPQWLQTKNAKTTMLDSGTSFLKQIGLIR